MSVEQDHAYFMNIAMAVRRRANCLGNRVGAVIAREGRIVSTGYNGTPEKMTNCLDGGCRRCSRRGEHPSGTAYDLCICVHAEQNALLSAARFGIAVEGGTLYTTLQPCFGCAKEMLQAKIRSIQYLHPWSHPLAAMRAEYKRVEKNFSGGMKHLKIGDTQAHWALSSKRN